MLDTNAYTAFAQGDTKVAQLVRNTEALLMSAIVVGELMYGFRHGSRFERNQATLDRFLANPFVKFLPITRSTADRFGRVATALRKKGRPIPTNDVWIAAHALETGANLLTFDRHFERIEGLVCLSPE